MLKRLFGVVCLVAVGLGGAPAVAKEAAPMSVDGAVTVNAAEAKALFDGGALFVDPRGDADYDAGRVPGAVHLPLEGGLTEGRRPCRGRAEG